MKGKVNSEGITTLEFTWKELTRLQIMVLGNSAKDDCGDLRAWDAVLEPCWNQARKINMQKREDRENKEKNNGTCNQSV